MTRNTGIRYLGRFPLSAGPPPRFSVKEMVSAKSCIYYNNEDI